MKTFKEKLEKFLREEIKDIMDEEPEAKMCPTCDNWDEENKRCKADCFDECEGQEFSAEDVIYTLERVGHKFGLKNLRENPNKLEKVDFT